MTQIRQTRYTGRTHTTRGRYVESRSSDGRPNIKGIRPGSAGDGTVPEHLFASGWSAGFIGAMGRVAQGIGVALPVDAAVDAEVDLASGRTNLLVQSRLQVSLPGLERAFAQAVIDGAHQPCPCTRETRGNIDVALTPA